jgi:hypothetical protein
MYGKAPCLSELIYSFLNQDYKGKKELIILNDLDKQKIVFNHPEVKIINLENRIIPLGAKFNKNVEYCQYDILSVMEIDDIYLSNHLSNAIQKMKNGIYHSNRAWSLKFNSDKLNIGGNYFHATHVFSRELFNQVGGYCEIDNTTVDIKTMKKFKDAIGPYTISETPINFTYIYRWVPYPTAYHASCHGKVDSVSKIVEKIVHNGILNGTEPSGECVIVPRWKNPYNDYVREALSKISI